MAVTVIQIFKCGKIEPRHNAGRPSTNNSTMAYAYQINYALRETTAEEVVNAFNSAFNSQVVIRIEESVTQDYSDTWNAFTVYLNQVQHGGYTLLGSGNPITTTATISDIEAYNGIVLQFRLGEWTVCMTYEN